MTEGHIAGTGRYRFGLFELDAATGELTREGRPVRVPPQPLRVLALLVERAVSSSETVVTRDELRAHLWGGETFVDFERGLNFAVQQVRAALHDSATEPRFIQTVPKRGYRFIAPVARVDGAAPPLDARPTADVDAAPAAAPRSRQDDAVRLSVPRPRGRRRGFAITAAGLVAVVVVGLAAIARTPVADKRAGNIGLPAHPDPAAEAYLRGRFFAERGGRDDLDRALAYFVRATELAPDHAAAWAARGLTLHTQVMIGARAASDAYPLAAAAARHALDADSQLAAAHAARGLVQLWFDWDPAGAERSFARAIELDPDDAGARHDHASSLVGLGRYDAAVEEIARARALNPLSPRANADVGWLLMQVRRPGDAATACERTLDLFPDFAEAQSCLERAHALQGNWSAALVAARSSRDGGARSHPPDAGGSAARSDTFVGDTAADRDALRRIWEARVDRLAPGLASGRDPYMLALHQALLDRTDAAIATLAVAVDRRHPMMVFLATDPAWDGLRADGRFADLVARVRDVASAGARTAV